MASKEECQLCIGLTNRKIEKGQRFPSDGDLLTILKLLHEGDCKEKICLPFLLEWQKTFGSGVDSIKG